MKILLSNILTFLLGIIVGYGITSSISKRNKKTKGTSVLPSDNSKPIINRLPGEINLNHLPPGAGITPETLREQLCNIWIIAYGDKPLLISAKKSFQYISDFLKYNDTDGQKNWWETFCRDIERWDLPQYVEKSKDLLNYIESKGVSHGSTSDIIWDEDSESSFICFDDIETGQKCKIFAPMFLYNGKLLKKGIVKPI